MSELDNNTHYKPTLVVMNSKDVYYIDRTRGDFLLDLLQQPECPQFVSFSDQKTGHAVTLQTALISAVIVLCGSDGGSDGGN